MGISKSKQNYELLEWVDFMHGFMDSLTNGCQKTCERAVKHLCDTYVTTFKHPYNKTLEHLQQFTNIFKTIQLSAIVCKSTRKVLAKHREEWDNKSV